MGRAILSSWSTAATRETYSAGTFVHIALGDGEKFDHGIGSDVVDLIFSMAKRDVTFFNGTAVISRL
jgi:hypothetical protein